MLFRSLGKNNKCNRNISYGDGGYILAGYFFCSFKSLNKCEVRNSSLNATIKDALRLAKEHGVVEPGDLVVVTAGDPGTSPTQGDYTTSTNMIMVCQIQ